MALAFRLAAGLVAVAPLAPPLWGGFTTSSEVSKEFWEIRSVVVVAADCAPSIDCKAAIQNIVDAFAQTKRLGITPVPPSRVSRALFEAGKTSYDQEMRDPLRSQLSADAVVEVSIPYSVAGDGAFGRRPSEVRVELRIFGPEGALLGHIESTGRLLNVVEGPHIAAGTAVKKALDELLQRHRRFGAKPRGSG